MKLLLLFSLIFGIFLLSMEFTSYDRPNHLHFASHYVEEPLSLIDHETGGGLDMSTYPPLFYQLIAFISRFIPLSLALDLVTLVFWITLSFFSAKFIVEYLNLGDGHFYLAYIFVFSSVGILKTLSVYSQVTTIAGLAFAFISLYYFWQLISNENSKKKNSAFFALALSLTAFTHHFSFLMVVPMLILFSVLNYEKAFTRQNLKKAGISLLLAFVIILVGLMPMVQSFVESTVPEGEIPHDSRKSFFQWSQRERNMWFYSTYGLSLLMLASPGLVRFVKLSHKWRFDKVYLLAIFFFLLGLGGSTQLPKLIYPGIEHWLTFDRFSLVSSILFTSILGVITYGLLKKLNNQRIKYGLLVSVVAGFLVLNLFWLQFSEELYFGEVDREESDELKKLVLDYLEENASRDYRYQTFGYDPTSSEIYSRTNVPTLETTYYSGRTIPWLRDSGEEEINHFSQDMFKVFMKKADNYSVKHIIAFTPRYHKLMEDYDWDLIRNESTADSQVKIWKNPRELEKVDYSEEKGFVNYLWGTIPPLMFVVFLVYLAKGIMGKLDEALSGIDLSAK